jgi:UDP-GlcNAc:undecaprenyl-phosphate/decaprenyl-phosphate GlcNAc-1-phosphate transferase
LQTVSVAFVISLAVALVLTPVVRWGARRLGWLDYAHTSRKIHGKPVPRLGGVAIVLAFFTPLVGLLFLDTGVGRMVWSDPQKAIALVVGSLAIAALGVYDDVKGSGARLKFSVQILVAVGMWWAGYRVGAVTTPFGSLDLGILGFPITIAWIVGVTNALNLIDGLDGLASGIALAATATIFWVSLSTGAPLMALFMACLGGALLGFLRYNFHPASIFMGDSGSLFVGFVLAATALQTREKSTTAVALLVPIVALALPIGDTLLAMTRRMVRGQPVFSSDRSHIHHRLMARGLSHRTTVLALYAIAVVLAGVAVALLHSDATQTVAYVGALVTIGVLLLLSAGYVRFDQARKLLSDRKNNLAMRARVREAADRLRQAEDPEDIWGVVREAAEAFNASSVALTLVARNGTVRTSEFSSGFDDDSPDLVRARFSLLGDRTDEGGIEFGFTDGRSTVDRDTEIAIELLCEHVHAAIERIAARHEAETSGNRKLLQFRK